MRVKGCRIEPEERLLKVVDETPSITEAPVWDKVYPHHEYEEGVLEEIAEAVFDVLRATELSTVCVGVEGMDSTLCAVAAAEACQRYGARLVLYTVGFYPGMPTGLTHARVYRLAEFISENYPEIPLSVGHLEVDPPHESKRELCRACGSVRFEAVLEAFPGSLVIGGANFGEAPHRASLGPFTEHEHGLEYRPLIDLALTKGHVVAGLREAGVHFPRFEWWKNESGCGVRDLLLDEPEPDAVEETARMNDVFHSALSEGGAHCGYNYDTAVVFNDGSKAYVVLIPLPWGWNAEAQRAFEGAVKALEDEGYDVEIGLPPVEPEDPPVRSVFKRARALGIIETGW